MSASRRSFEIRAEWDNDGGVWWCSNDELPLTTEAATFEQLVSRVLEIVPEIAAENGLAAPGDEIDCMSSQSALHSRNYVTDTPNPQARIQS